MSMVGQTIAHYTITEKLGQDGMAEVRLLEALPVQDPARPVALSTQDVEDPREF